MKRGGLRFVCLVLRQFCDVSVEDLNFDLMFTLLHARFAIRNWVGSSGFDGLFNDTHRDMHWHFGTSVGKHC